mgnify:CR=1 FL=1
MTKIKIFSSAKQLTQAAVTCFVELAQQSIAKQDGFAVALSGGSTPRSIYQELAKSEHQTFLNWEKIHLFWGDERHVPPDDPESNYKMVKDALLKHIEIPKENIHRVPAEKTVHEAAYLYEAELRQFFVEDWPRFDLVLLGMGTDGHTASLFPRSAGLEEEKRWFIGNQVSEIRKWRLTLTKYAINAARNVIVLVQGASKANMLAEVLAGPYSPEEKPIQLISPVNGEMIWMVDADAASSLPENVISYFSGS